MLNVNGSHINRLMASLLFVFTVLWLVGCGTLSQQSQDNGQSHNPVQPLSEQPIFDGLINDYDGCAQAPTEVVNQMCASKNGIMQRAGMMGCYRCIVSYTDAHKPCHDNSECQGECRAKQSDFFKAGTGNVIGVCAESNNPFGCYQTIENGIAQSAMCID